MANVVNIFLGGTGKYIAGLQKARATMYQTQPPSMLVFDTDPRDLQTRNFRLGRELRTPRAAFGDNLRSALTEWGRYNLDSIRQLNDSTRETDIKMAPFDTAMAPFKAASRLLPENRAGGAGLWTLRAHGHIALGRYLKDDEQAVHFLDDVEQEVSRQAAGGHPVRVNIVASVAGGTGSGVFLPMALKLRERLSKVGQGISAEICLYLVLPSAFYNDWGTGAGSGAIVTRTRGLTGAFAAWRELQFLLEQADPGATFRPRILPLLSDGSETVSYEPSAALVRQIYWAGMRVIDHNQRSHALFDEVGRVLAVLSDPAIDTVVGGQNVTQSSGAKLCWSAVCIEYPLLELAQKYSATAVARAMDQIAGTADDTPLMDTLYREFVSRDNAGRPLSRFLDAERQGVLADERDPAIHKAQADHMEEFLETGGPGAAKSVNLPIRQPQSIAVAHGTGFAAENEAKWEQMALAQGQAMDAALVVDVANCKEAMRRWLDRERQAFNGWVSLGTVQRMLTEGRSAEAVLGTLGAPERARSIHGELKRVRDLFSRSFSDVVSLSGGRDCFRGVEHCESEYARRKQELINPPVEQTVAPGLRWLLTLIVGALVGLGVWYVASSLEVGDTASKVVGVLVGIVAAVLAYQLLGRQPSIEQRREKAERALIGAYEELRLAHCGQALWGKDGLVCQRFLNPILGIPGAKDADPGSLGQAKRVVRDLQAVCRRASDESDALATQSLSKPPDVAVWIGDEDRPTPDALQDHIRLVREHLYMAAISGGDAGAINGLSLRVGEPGEGGRYALSELARITHSEATDDDKNLWLDFSEVLQENAWQLVRQRLGLPPNLEARLRQEAGQDEEELLSSLADRLIDLVELQRTRGAAIASFDAVPAPVLQMLLVKDAGMQALVGPALGHAHLARRPNEREALRRGLTSNDANGRPHVSSSVGESIVLLALYDLPAIPRLRDIEQSRQQYYSENEPVDTGTPLVRYCAGNSEFQLLPELSAAASIEFDRRRYQPLHPVLVPHLLGSDPEYPGPTTLTLFYLARQQRWLTRQDYAPTGNVPRQRWMFGDPERGDGDGVPLLIETAQDPVRGDPATAAGRGRLLDPLDALNDFLRYHGQPPGEATVTGLNSGSEICVRAWHDLGDGLKERQRCLRNLWWDLWGKQQDTKRRTCFAEMRELLTEDLPLLPEGDLRDSWKVAANANLDASERLLQGI